MIEAIRADLATIAESARWAYNAGYGKRGSGLTAERGERLSADDMGRDEVPGPTYDLEIGDHRARQAYAKTCRVVSEVDTRIMLLLWAQGIPEQPPRLTLNPYSTPLVLLQVIRNAVWRLDDLADGSHKSLRYCSVELGKAVSALGKALQFGVGGTERTDHLCVTCEARPKVTRTNAAGESKAARNECETCRKWRARHGEARPASELHELDKARAAKKRRLDRGEGWGVA